MAQRWRRLQSLHADSTDNSSLVCHSTCKMYGSACTCVEHMRMPLPPLLTPEWPKTTWPPMAVASFQTISIIGFRNNGTEQLGKTSHLSNSPGLVILIEWIRYVVVKQCFSNYRLSEYGSCWRWPWHSHVSQLWNDHHWLRELYQVNIIRYLFLILVIIINIISASWSHCCYYWTFACCCAKHFTAMIM
jgi:hypothetical protein